ncbi:MAG: hypothetical protein R3F54_16860 [Alphaproteobacteria bacterium]
MTKPILTWDDVDIDAFGVEPLRIKHRLHESPLFSDDMLATLIEQSARENYYVNTMDITSQDRRTRREGETGDISGKDALQAVKDGSIWYLLMRPEQVDPRYRELVDEIYDEIASHVPGFDATSRKLSILVSSPNIQVFYHTDVPGQTLWQVRGVKRVYVYPPRFPYLPQPNLERVVMGEAHEISLDYDPAFDQDAVVFDLEPGQMLHWPLNAPHRISNHDCVNVSFTTEHSTRDTRRAFIVNYANGVLRRSLGVSELSQATGGPLYWAKYGVAGAYKMLGMNKKRSLTYKVDFRVDPSQPKGFRDITPYEFGK